LKERTISFIEAQQQLESLPEQFSEACPALIITRNNQPVLSIMPYATHQALLENIASLQTVLEIMASQAAEGASQSGHAPAPATHSISWEEFQKEVGWD
jgi:PHD/YefM family antitoxin component YafN of YafNO toxin-antitoxin module